MYGNQKIGGPVNVENDPNIPQGNNNNIIISSNNSNNNVQSDIIIHSNINNTQPKQPNMTNSKAVSEHSNLTATGTNEEISIQPISAISPYHNRYFMVAC